MVFPFEQVAGRAGAAGEVGDQSFGGMVEQEPVRPGRPLGNDDLSPALKSPLSERAQYRVDEVREVPELPPDHLSA